MGKKKKPQQQQAAPKGAQPAASQGAQQPTPQGTQQAAQQGASQSAQQSSQPPVQRAQHPGGQGLQHQRTQEQQKAPAQQENWRGAPPKQQSQPAWQGSSNPQQPRQQQEGRQQGQQPRHGQQQHPQQSWQGQQGVPAQQIQYGTPIRQGPGAPPHQSQYGPPGLQGQQGAPGYPSQHGPPGWPGQQSQYGQPGRQGQSQPQQHRQGQPRGPAPQQQYAPPPQQQSRQPAQHQEQPVRQPQQQQPIPQQLPPQPKQGWKQLSSPPSSRDVSHSPSPVHELKRLKIGDVPETPQQAGGEAAGSVEVPSNVKSIKEEAKPPPPQTPPATSPGMELAIPHRSKHNKTGTKGRRIPIETNHLLLQIKDLKPIIHYDVAIEPDKPKKLLRVVMEECRIKNYPKRYPAYDGSKSLYSSSYLPFQNQMNDEIRIMENDREKSYKVIIKYATTIDLNALQKYFQSVGSGQTIIPQDAIQCLDVVLRSAPSLRCIPVGRSFFTRPDRFMDLGEGMEMYHGFFQSAILGWKPFLNVDVAHKAFPKSLGVVNLIEELCEGPQRQLAGKNFTDVDKFLKNLKVRYEIPNNPSSKRISRINQLDKPASAARFKDENGTEMTVADYYTRNKNYRLKFPDLPCLWIGSRERKILYPAELCTLLEGQVTNRAMTPNQTTKMIKHAATPCDERKRKIMASVTAARFNDDACAREFGITVSNQFTKIDARVLSSPALLYSKRAVQPSKGVWRADQFQIGKPLSKWAILCVDGRTRETALQAFADKMIMQGRIVGMIIEKPENLIVKRLNYRSPKEDLKSEFIKFKHLELVVVVIPDDKDTYGYVKQVAELNMGTLTQCVRGRNVFNSKDATVANILLKVNAKLNGVNHSLHVTPACLRRPCMIMGADVTHPSPESRGTQPSVAAVTASHDPKAFQYNISWRLQPPTQEIISDLANIVKDHLLFFYKKNNKMKPDRIIFFRDGVSEGQFRQVLQEEVTAIRNACLMLQRDGTYQPKVTFLVVQKRHHTRFFPQNSRDSEDRNLNVPAGTIVDTEITHPTDVDFYLVSHASIQGTARPTRYRKLWDDSDMDEDELEELTYHLCHMFTRCTRSVSYPAPTYYAHLAAARAKVYCENIQIDVNNLGRTQAQLVIRPEIIAGMPMFFV